MIHFKHSSKVGKQNRRSVGVPANGMLRPGHTDCKPFQIPEICQNISQKEETKSGKMLQKMAAIVYPQVLAQGARNATAKQIPGVFWFRISAR